MSSIFYLLFGLVFVLISPPPLPLLNLLMMFISSLDEGQLTGAIFIDLTKAFDLADHYLLLDKFYAIGFSQQALLWFNLYLHNRRQRVSFQHHQSDYLIVDKGVPQGSILGPLLFTIFINDLPNVCSNCSVHLYADDTVIYTSDSDITTIQRSLQNDFCLLQKWFSNNSLILNKQKSCFMLFGTSLIHLSSVLVILSSDGSRLKKVDTLNV